MAPRDTRKEAHIVTTQLDYELDQTIRRRYGTAADDASVERAAAALRANGIDVVRAVDAADGKRIVLGLVPVGSHVYHGASESLEVTGITDAIENSGLYDPIRPRIWSMDRATQGDEIRR